MESTGPWVWLLKKYIFIFFIFDYVGCHCSAQSFSNFGEQGLISSFCVRASHCSGFSLGTWASVAVVPRA